MEADNVRLNQIQSALSAAGDPWVAGVTSVSALPLEEQKKRLGVTPPPGEPSLEEIAQRVRSIQGALKAEALAAVGVPAAYDLRDVGGKNFVTPIRDQENCGSCVAFGTVATVESRLRVQRNNPNLAVDLSEAHLFFCYGHDTGVSCATGWWPTNAFEAFQSQGVADEACYPYDNGLATQDCSGLCANWAERVVKITGYTDLTSKPAQIKEAIATKGPVCACFIVYEDFFSYRSGIYRHVTGGQVGAHCVTIVGYNDTPGYWICKNSWGTGWGEQGFFRIAYGECGIDSWLNHSVQSAVPLTLSVAPTSVAAGGTVTATWSGIPDPTPTDWLGLYTSGASNTDYEEWRYTTGTADGNVPFSVPDTLAPGPYEVRLLSNDGFTLLATSNPFTVTGEVTLSVAPTSVAAGGTVTATWSGIPDPTPTDWLGLYTSGASNTDYEEWRYTTGTADGNVPFSVPDTLAPGPYEVRLLSNDGFTLLATSNPLTVTAPAGALNPGQ